jgi:hypothetical protein
MVVCASSSKEEEAPESAWRPVKKEAKGLRRDLGLVGLGQRGVGVGVEVDLGALQEEGGAREGVLHPGVTNLDIPSFLFGLYFCVLLV